MKNEANTGSAREDTYGGADMREVKQTFVQIAALEEEADGYKREAKRIKQDIAALYLSLPRKVTSQQTALELTK